MNCRVWSLGLMIISLVGCGGGAGIVVVPVSGKLTRQGKPVEKALVTFMTTASPRSAVGTTNANGEFKLTTINTDDGAMPGEHVITISKMPEPGANSAALPQTPEDYAKYMSQQPGGSRQPPGKSAADKSIPEKYGSPSTSGLKRTVVKGEPNHFEIDLTE